MQEKKVISNSPDSTMTLARKLAKSLKPGDILCLVGNLGCGKTTFVKGLARGLRIKPERVSSPTFVLMNIYEGKLPLYHFDLYRLEEIGEMQALGYEEFLYGDGVSVIEWAERIQPLLQKEYLEIQFKHSGEDRRQLQFVPRGNRYIQLVKKL